MAKAETTKGLKVKVSILDKVYETGRKYAAGFKKTMKFVFDKVLPKMELSGCPRARVKSASYSRPIPKCDWAITLGGEKPGPTAKVKCPRDGIMIRPPRRNWSPSAS